MSKKRNARKPARKKKPTQTFDVNDSWLDVDLPEAMPVDMSMGLVEEDLLVARANFDVDDFESFGSARFMIPQGEWRDIAERIEARIRELVRVIMNQGREGACVGFATTQAVHVRSSFQFPSQLFRELSGMSLYNRIGRSAQSGAMMSDGARESAEDGILPLDTPANRQLYKHVYRPRGFVGERRMNQEVPGWESTAELFKPTWLRINSFSAWMSALLQGMPIMYGRQGHAICSLLPKFHRGDWWVGYLNSWGEWGDVVNSKLPHGMGWDSRRVIQRCVGYTCVSVSTRPGEMNL